MQDLRRQYVQHPNMTPRIDPGDVRFFSGRSHPELAARIADHLGLPLEKTVFSRFSNDNLFIQLGASVRGGAVFIIQSLVPPVSEHLMELFMMLDIARGAGAREVHAVIPYFSYARSDKKNAPRISITARLIADLLQTSGATQVMIMTLHSAQVHGFFSVPTDPLTARNMFVKYFQELAAKDDWEYKSQKTVIVAPDYGRAGSATRLAAQLDLPAIAAEKTRISDTEVHISELICRQVEGFYRALIYDDEISTGGSVITLCQLLINSGVEEIYINCTHGLFISNALERIFAIPQVKQVITTDTVPIHDRERFPNLTVLSVASIIGDAIWKNHTRQSIGGLFVYGDEDEEQEP
jgi:ribose-phosphate pyrophosphokinase